jgi:2-amino-4-hydroxy-6-hydroxymethyldihydropteridine diphosphokinase
MIYALSIGTNVDHAAALAQAQQHLALLGECEYSAVFELPDRQGHGPLYWNLAVLLRTSSCSVTDMEAALHQIEQCCGRVRPSLLVRLDLDLIAYGASMAQLVVVRQRQPLPLDVTLPLATLWADCPDASLVSSGL